MGVMARDVTHSKTFSGLDPSHGVADASSTVLVPYVEDTTAFSTALEISNPGSITANVTVHFFDTGDATGGSSGTQSTRDIAVAINSGAPIADIVRWVLRSTSTTPSGKRGFIVVTTSQGAVTAQARIVDKASGDPAVPESNAAISSGFSPVLVRVDPFAFAKVDAAAAAPSTMQSRFSLSNPSPTTATVQLIANNATGSPAGAPFVVTLAPNGQFFSDDLARDMGLPPVFLGSVTVQSDVPVLVYNQRMTGDGGSAVPVHGQ
jgi:hypothetical protein